MGCDQHKRRNIIMGNLIKNDLSVNIKAVISRNSDVWIRSELEKLYGRLFIDTQYVIAKIFLEIDHKPHRETLNYKNKNDITIYIKPVIENYVQFKTHKEANEFLKERLCDDEIYLFLKVNFEEEKLEFAYLMK
jgi:hypothetical protein